MTIGSGPNSIPPSNRENGTTGSRQKTMKNAAENGLRYEKTYLAGTTGKNVSSGYDMKKRIELIRTKKRTRPKKRNGMK